MFQVVSSWFIKNRTSEWLASKTTRTIFVSNHIVFKVVKHSLCGEVSARVWSLSKNDKQDVGKTLDSVKVVCLCEKGRCKVISSYSSYTHSSGWVLLDTPNLMNMPYSVKLNICFFSFLYQSASFVAVRYYLARYSQAAAKVAATTPRVLPQMNTIVK